ncbi:hypothetical protein [Streptomyces sp. NBRC 110465]|uniref:hypothetical protein n=1 Tax=Streptomyces sp. NBRC 110465 TaxID=1897621 RepID=UPI001F215BBE|nr:hypothetical protein [Streptomyces sp. NBRC 110465]
MTKTKEHAEGTCPLPYQCLLPLSTRTVNHLAELLRRHLKAIRCRWRILPPGKIAVIVLALLRHDQRSADMAGGNHVSESTVRRWRDELIGLLAAQAPRLDRALRKVAKQGGEVVLIDGALTSFAPSAAPEERTAATNPASTGLMACTSSPDRREGPPDLDIRRPARPHPRQHRRPPRPRPGPPARRRPRGTG